MRKSTLYAGRVRGDIAPGLEPTRLGGDNEKAWARMDFPGRILPGQTDQVIYESSDTRKFEIGTRRIEHGRTFRYAQAGSELLARSRLGANGNFTPEDPAHLNEDGFWGDLYGTGAAIEDTYVDLETATAYPAHWFQGGYFTTWPAVPAAWPMHYIVDSDLGNGDYCRLYLDHPLEVAIDGATIGVEAHRSPYSNIIEGLVNQNFKSFVGLKHCGTVTIAHFFWLQTAGPCWLTPTNWTSKCPGYAGNQMEVYADEGGTCRNDPADHSRQRIGYLLPATAVNYGAVFIMLQLE